MDEPLNQEMDPTSGERYEGIPKPLKSAKKWECIMFLVYAIVQFIWSMIILTLFLIDSQRSCGALWYTVLGAILLYNFVFIPIDFFQTLIFILGYSTKARLRFYTTLNMLLQTCFFCWMISIFFYQLDCRTENSTLWVAALLLSVAGAARLIHFAMASIYTLILLAVVAS